MKKRIKYLFVFQLLFFYLSVNSFANQKEINLSPIIDLLFIDESKNLHDNNYVYDNNRKIYYEKEGNGRPLLFVHGLYGDHMMWDNQKSFFLSKGFQVITLDLAGSKHSDELNDSEYTMEQYGKDVALLIRELELNDVILIAHSMGGKVVLEALKEVYSEVKGVIGIDTLDGLLSTGSKPAASSSTYNKLNNDYENISRKFLNYYLGDYENYKYISKTESYLLKSKDVVINSLKNIIEHKTSTLFFDDLNNMINKKFNYCVISTSESTKNRFNEVVGDSGKTVLEIIKERINPNITFDLRKMDNNCHFIMIIDEEVDRFNQILLEEILKF